MTERVWWYAKDGASLGPHSANEIAAMLRHGSLLADDLLWREGQGEWIALRELPEFAPLAPPPVPEPAAAAPAAPEPEPPLLWNPNAAALWSVLFSPIFGAWLHALNWKTLGRPDKQRLSIGAAVFGALLIVAALLLPEKVSRGMGLPWLLVWYYALGREQIAYVQGKFGDNYRRRGWLQPIAASVGASFILALALVIGLLAYTPETVADPTLKAMTGVWQDSRGSLVFVRLDGDEKQIAIDGNAYPVEVTDIDAERGLVTLKAGTADGKHPLWTLARQGPRLRLTLHDGRVQELGFVRALRRNPPAGT